MEVIGDMNKQSRVETTWLTVVKYKNHIGCLSTCCWQLREGGVGVGQWKDWEKFTHSHNWRLWSLTLPNKLQEAFIDSKTFIQKWPMPQAFQLSSPCPTGHQEPGRYEGSRSSQWCSNVPGTTSSMATRLYIGCLNHSYSILIVTYILFFSG